MGVKYARKPVMRAAFESHATWPVRARLPESRDRLCDADVVEDIVAK